MIADIALHLRDLSVPLVEAWRRELAGAASVTVSCGDIFSEREGMVGPDDPIDIRADAVVSPANSFGLMDGGIDAVYTYVFGDGLQTRLREVIARDHGGELPVGTAAIVPTMRTEIPWCISAPTMRIPAFVGNTANAYLAFRAALRAVLDHNARGMPRIRTVLSPGMATAVGRMPPTRAARQMRIAWERVVGGQVAMPSSWPAAGADDDELLR